MWWFDKTWRVNFSSYDLSKWLEEGSEARTTCQLVKLTIGNLSSGTCHLRKKIRIVSALEKVLARFACHFFGCFSLSKIGVSGWIKCEIWPWHNPSPISFSRCKQSRSSKGSTHWQKMGINKKTESERISRQRRRGSQCSCWLKVVYMFPESKIFLPDKSLRSFK